MLSLIEFRLQAAAKHSALGLVAGIFMLIGFGFLTAASFIALTLVSDALTAALIIGGACFGLGLIVMGFRAHSQRRAARAYAMLRPSTPAMLIDALVQGFAAGSAKRGDRR